MSVDSHAGTALGQTSSLGRRVLLATHGSIADVTTIWFELESTADAEQQLTRYTHAKLQ